MMSLDELKDKLRDRRLLVVAEETGLSYPTLLKIAKGETGGYNTTTLEKLTEYFQKG